MTESIQYKDMADRITEIFKDMTDDPELLITTYIENELESLDSLQKTRALDKLIARFESMDTENKGHENYKAADMVHNDHVLARVIRLLLGRDITQVDLSNEELLESLGESINTVFEALNQLISVINTTLVGKQDSDETIRQVIGYHIEGGQNTGTLENYIGQIGKAFFASQQASKKAAHTKVMQILEELSPGKIEKEADVSRLSPMRKSKYYEVYELKFKKFEKWFESGRFMESFLREFERNCQKITL